MVKSFTTGHQCKEKKTNRPLEEGEEDKQTYCSEAASLHARVQYGHARVQNHLLHRHLPKQLSKLSGLQSGHVLNGCAVQSIGPS